jgi:hypothetical protein
MSLQIGLKVFPAVKQCCGCNKDLVLVESSVMFDQGLAASMAEKQVKLSLSPSVLKKDHSIETSPNYPKHDPHSIVGKNKKW